MLVRGQTTEQRIAEIAGKFQEGLKGYQAGQQRFNEAQQQENKYQDALTLQKNELELKKEERKRALGIEAEQKVVRDLDLEKKKYDLGQTLKPVAERDSFKEKAALQNMKPVPQTYEQKLEIKAQKDAEVNARKANIADFEIANPSVIPSSKDAEEMKKLNLSNKNLQDAGTGLITKLGKINTLDRTGLTNNWKLIEQDLTQMALQGKELANLGALSGPDFELMNKDIGSITLSSINTIGAKGAVTRIQSMIDRAQSKVHNAASSRGYKPLGAGANAAQAARAAKIKWLQENP